MSLTSYRAAPSRATNKTEPYRPQPGSILLQGLLSQLRFDSGGLLHPAPPTRIEQMFDPKRKKATAEHAFGAAFLKL
jgi:hypothetical protein